MEKPLFLLLHRRDIKEVIQVLLNQGANVNPSTMVLFFIFYFVMFLFFPKHTFVEIQIDISDKHLF